jgi:four helix bundle protein
MNSYKEMEIYKLAFDLAIKVYIINMALPRHELIKEGNVLRRCSVGIKDTIAEGFAEGKNSMGFVRSLYRASLSCDETIALLKKIKKIHFRENTINEIIRNYIILKNKIYKEIESIEKSSNIIGIPNPENQLLEQEI